MDKRNGFTRWISIMLMVGLIVTSLPAGVGFGSEIVQNTIAEEKTSEDGSNPAAEPTKDEKNVDIEGKTAIVKSSQSAIARMGNSKDEVQPLAEKNYIYLKNNGSNGNNTRIGCLQFDLDKFKKVEDITSVTLAVYAYSVKGKNNTRIKFWSAIDDEWSEQTLTGSSMPEKHTLISSTSVIESTEKRYNVDVTQYVKANLGLNKEKKVTFILESAEFDSYAQVYVATEKTSEELSPRLFVHYSDTETTQQGSEMDSSQSDTSNADNDGVMEMPQGDGASEDFLTSKIEQFGYTGVTFEDIESEWDKTQKQKRLVQAKMEGTGTVSDPYLIYTAEQLQAMTENDIQCYKLMCDIDLKGRSWRPVGYYYWYPFMGYLDGNGHKITNLYVGGTANDAWSINAGGLFGYFEGRVENLGVETVKAKRKGVDFFGFAGGIAGVANAPAEIENCYFNGYVAGANYAGGLVGISYPGTRIVNCCAIGTVDMSQSFEYLNDNAMQYGKDSFDVLMDGLSWSADVALTVIEIWWGDKKEGIKDAIKNITDLITKYNDAISTEYMTGIRRCSIGGLVGLNYGYIGNSYAAVNRYNIKAGTNTWKTKVGGIAGRNLAEGLSDKIENCRFDEALSGGTESDESSWGTTKNGIIGFCKNIDGKWDTGVKILLKKSTEGYPLPKYKKVKRNKRIAKIGVKSTEVEPEIYYTSRVPMKTRENYIIGEETKNGMIACSVCEELERDSLNRAVTGKWQKGSIDKPYHIHDIDSMLSMQDSKESHFILCDNIDFKVSDGKNTIQKYWWPAGKTHFSPIKGSLKGNTSYNYLDKNQGYRINGSGTRTKTVTKEEKRFSIKNLTVQSNRHAGLFASFRGTISDVNIWVSSGRWENWRDGIGGIYNEGGNAIIGISTIGESASAGAIAGETVTGALIRRCNIGGIGCKNGYEVAAKSGHKMLAKGCVKGSLRGGGIVGLLMRGARITGCKSYMCADVSNYNVHFGEDQFKRVMTWTSAYADTVSAIVDLVSSIQALSGQWNNNPKDILDEVAELTGENNKISLGRSRFNLARKCLSSLTSIFMPLMNAWLELYSQPCSGNAVGELYGEVSKCTIYKATPYQKPWWDFFDNEVYGYVGEYDIRSGNYNDEFLEDIVLNYVNDDSTENAILKQQKVSYVPITSVKKGLSWKGTKQEPFKIKTEKDLRLLAKMLSEGYDFEGVYIEQRKNINLDEPFECMGLSSRTPFKGIYNGNHCTISGIDIQDNTEAAFFYKLEDASVFNLDLEGTIQAPITAGIALYADDFSHIYDSSSRCDLKAPKVKIDEAADEIISSESKSAGLVYKMTNSFLANSYVKGRIQDVYRAAGLVYTVLGNSEIANTYSAIDAGETYRFEEIAFDFDFEKSFCANCFGQTQSKSLDLDSFGKITLGDTHDRIKREYPNIKMVSETQMKSDEILNDLINQLTKDVDGSILDLSECSTWERGKDGYPAFKPINHVIDLVQPAVGSLLLETSFTNVSYTTWTPVEDGIIKKGTSFRVTLNNLPKGKQIDYWTINGSKDPITGSAKVMHRVLDYDMKIGVVLKDGPKDSDLERVLTLKEPVNGNVSLHIVDNYRTTEEPEYIKISVLDNRNVYVESKNSNLDNRNVYEESKNSKHILDRDSKGFIGETIDGIQVGYNTEQKLYSFVLPYDCSVQVEARGSEGYVLTALTKNREAIIKDEEVNKEIYMTEPFRLVQPVEIEALFGMIESKYIGVLK